MGNDFGNWDKFLDKGFRCIVWPKVDLYIDIKGLPGITIDTISNASDYHIRNILSFQEGGNALKSLEDKIIFQDEVAPTGLTLELTFFKATLRAFFIFR